MSSNTAVASRTIRCFCGSWMCYHGSVSGVTASLGGTKGCVQLVGHLLCPNIVGAAVHLDGRCPFGSKKLAAPCR
eukprot:4813848-Prymnesium_polylepis.1